MACICRGPDGDGLDDIVIGAPGKLGGAGSSSLHRLRRYVLPLPRGLTLSSISLTEVDAKLVGERGDDFAGGAVSGGSTPTWTASPTWPSEAELKTPPTRTWQPTLFGPLVGTVDLSESLAKHLGDETGDWAGASVDMAGDLDGDGSSDLIIGAPQRDEGDFTDVGMVFLLKGGW